MGKAAKIVKAKAKRAKAITPKEKMLATKSKCVPLKAAKMVRAKAKIAKVITPKKKVLATKAKRVHLKAAKMVKVIEKRGKAAAVKGKQSSRKVPKRGEGGNKCRRSKVLEKKSKKGGKARNS